MMWEELTREKKTMEKYMAKRTIGGWEKWTILDLKRYAYARIAKLFTDKKPIKPYKIKNKRYIIEKVFSIHAPKLHPKYKSIIRTTINQTARRYYLRYDSPVNSTHARTVDIHLINEIAMDMWKGNLKDKQC